MYWNRKWKYISYFLSLKSKKFSTVWCFTNGTKNFFPHSRDSRDSFQPDGIYSNELTKDEQVNIASLEVDT